MLPITNHRVMHVPHSLAIGAAIIGLIVALSFDRPDREPAEANGRVASVTVDEPRRDENPQHTGLAPRENRVQRDTPTGLGPLFFVLPSGLE